ncbi:MAG: tagaturonate reductase [Clostridia bacterium]|nr:tagaturonate reductase [Clostridia bacterium]
MIKIAQFGEGNFLRAFADYYFDVLNEEGGNYSVSIIRPCDQGSLDKFVKQKNSYHVVLRGMEQGKPIERIRKISVVKEAFSYFDKADYERLATDSELKLIISNTTEAGIYFSDKDDMNHLHNSSYPAKLTAFLYSRFLSGLGGVYILPVELIDNNADRLKECVNEYIRLWQLPEAFLNWNQKENFYCNTLVDRIVSGYPKKEEERFAKLLNERDELLTVGEPFGLWVIENKGNISKFIREGKHGTEVILADTIEFYKKRKVRVLNGSHTNMVFISLWTGAKTVFDVMNSRKLRAFVKETLQQEIIPFVSNDSEQTKSFAKEVLERFENPYINHQLISISLNSISKWKARVLPSFIDYYEKFGKIPPNLTLGLSYFIHTYRSLYKKGDAYYFHVESETYELKDDKNYLDFFLEGGTVTRFLSDKIWGVDLNGFSGLTEAIKENLSLFQRDIKPL